MQTCGDGDGAMYTGNLAASAATAGYVVLAEGGIELAKSLVLSR